MSRQSMKSAANKNQAHTNTSTNRVVVLGSGYGGIHTCRTLLKNKQPQDDLEVILLSNVDHLLYVTMIYEVPAGNLAPSSIRQSVRTMFAGDDISFVRGQATAIDLDSDSVTYKPLTGDDQSADVQTMSFDYLVSAIGSETQFFDTPGAREHAYRLKELQHAKALKNALIQNFERAERVDTEKEMRELLSVVVVGGGPTGVTLAAKIADLLNNELSRAFPKLSEYAEVTILEAGDTVAKRAGPWFSHKVTNALQEKPKVNIKTNCPVNEVHADGVSFGDDEKLSSECVIWTAGVKARELEFANAQMVNIDDHSRRVHVTPQLHLPDKENVFVVGDQAWVERTDTDQPHPMRAQFAVRQGQQAGRNVLASARGRLQNNFHWKDKGMVISAGHGHTFAEVFGIKMSGFFATVAYKSIYLMSTIGFRAKARAVLEWFMNMFLPRDISEL